MMEPGGNHDLGINTVLVPSIKHNKAKKIRIKYNNYVS